MSVTEIKTATSKLRLGKPEHYRNLWVVPVFDGADEGPLYLSLREALQRELAEITEVSEGGSVPELRVKNKADLPLLLVDGEELAGAKQNRIVNTSMLLPAHAETLIPVSCTEAGRWSYRSDRFRESGYIMSSKPRFSKSGRIKENLEHYAKYDAGQSQVWSEVSSLHSKLGTISHTSAMSDAYEQRSKDMEAYLSSFPLQEGQKGMIALFNRKLAGFDFLSRAKAYGDIHDKLLRSYAVEALVEPEEETAENDILAEVNRFLEQLGSAPETSRNTPVGLGEDIRFEDTENSGFKLVYEDTIIHEHGFRKAVAMEA